MFYNKFWRRYKKQGFILFLFLIPFIPFLSQKFTLPRIHFDELLSTYIIHPVASLNKNLSGGVVHLWDDYLALVNTEKRNRELNLENQDLKKKILELSELSKENERLTEILKINKDSPIKSQAARIIGYDSSPEAFIFYINAGRDQGLKENMPVVTPHGVIGHIHKLFKKTAAVLTAIDPQHTLDGLIERSRARMIIEGQGEELKARLKYLDRSEDVQVGDSVITSGLDGIFPKGLMVGQIIEIKRPQYGVVQEASLRLSVDLGKLEDVNVLLFQQNDELGEAL
ncbi:MAG: rod shape-determining protein MreC [Proteobacteria bacterium]|nr:rod shape-determining protein MreC [Pseudomonadota bacterium]